jgi:hypothetical protein
LIKPGGKLVFNIKNYNRVTFDESSLKSLQLESTSSFTMNIESSGIVLFKSKCAKQWTAYQTAALPDSAPSDTVTFRLNMTNVEAVYFEKESLAEMEIDKASTFQIVVNKFNKVVLGKSAFGSMIQSARGNFELNVSNGKQIRTSEDLFNGLNQSQNAKVLLNLNNVAESSDLCLRKNTFANVVQAFNSTIRVAISMSDSGNVANSVVFGAQAFNSIKQDTRAVFQVYLLNAGRVVLEKLAVMRLIQARASLFEIWSSKASSSLVVKNGAFKSTRQAEESVIKMSFVPGTRTEGGFLQAPMVFDDFASALNSQVVYDFTQSKYLHIF